ncbi:FxsA family protein [Jannaschia ovalis]|uniref:FxsA family protein n=1 Tax=Jannaschia ovalis TaxID=3038773 RepID=A0ABY8LG89_9RHOB|nr:FxsA family protein [Jannaschia sp. GRR-S6-38]WGH80286.1 FxsA family protein [Jannaschia sp. GRR-S6-38]
MWLFAIFVAVPILEIALFIQVGGWIGLWPTLAIVVATAALGTFLVRRQGLAEIRRIQRSLEELNDPTRPLAHGAMILASGLLLLTPGFFTDGLGFALLVPQVRDLVLAKIRKRVRVQSFTVGTGPRDPRHPPQPDDVIEGDYVEMPRRDGPSGWTQPRD